MIAKNLVLALNDKGTLGFITGSLLQLQDSIIGSAIKHNKRKLALKDTAHYHLAKQLAIIRHAGLDDKVPIHKRVLAGNFIVNALDKLYMTQLVWASAVRSTQGIPTSAGARPHRLSGPTGCQQKEASTAQH